jgi:hypothetical protein
VVCPGGEGNGHARYGSLQDPLVLLQGHTYSHALEII